MGIINEIMEIKKEADKNKRLAEHYSSSEVSYSIEKYQKEFFYYMQNVYPFINSEYKIALKNKVSVTFSNITKVPNYPNKQNWTLCNLIMKFYKGKELLMNVTVNNEDLTKEMQQNRPVDVIGINCISVAKKTNDSNLFLLAIESFKYVMKNPDEILSQLSKKAEDDYRYIIYPCYYDNLDEIQVAKDLGIMVKQYMNSPSSYVPFESVKVDRPDFSKMNLQELVAEFERKGNRDEVEKAFDALGEVVMDEVPNLEEKAIEISNFFLKIADKEEYISDSYDVARIGDEKKSIENNGFSYYFTIYGSSSQMLIDIKKDGNRIGSLYYWRNRRNRNRTLYLYIQAMGASKLDLRGFGKDTIPVFMDALVNLSNNWNDIIPPILAEYLDSYQILLSEYKKIGEGGLEEKKRAMEDFYKRQDEVASYF